MIQEYKLNDEVIDVVEEIRKTNNRKYDIQQIISNIISSTQGILVPEENIHIETSIPCEFPYIDIEVHSQIRANTLQALSEYLGIPPANLIIKGESNETTHIIAVLTTRKEATI